MTAKVSQETETALKSECRIKRVNCWEVLDQIQNRFKIISSQTMAVMPLEVQRIVAESLVDGNATKSALY